MGELEEIMGTAFRIGVDNAGESFIARRAKQTGRSGRDVFNDPLWREALDLLGVQFVVFHYSPEGGEEEQIRFVRELSDALQRDGRQYILNTETSNWVESVTDDEGWDWTAWPDGTHRFRFKPSVLNAAASSPAFMGVIYDEPEHMQLHRNWVWKRPTTANSSLSNDWEGKSDLPFMADTNGMSFSEAGEAIHDNARTLVETYKKQNTPYIVTEHVFPVLFHTFARAGMTPSCKLMKEGWAQVGTACAMGAALQYGRELWMCLDLWFLDAYPGHSPQELEDNLMFSYWVGSDKAYVENMNYNGSLLKTEEAEDGSANLCLSPWGEKLRTFTHVYLPKYERPYSFRDIRPDIAIIRFDDSDCGQAGDPFWPEWLLGSNGLNCDARTGEWLKIWHLLSHGVIPPNGLSWNHASKYAGINYRSFAPLNNVIVFDHTVRYEHLRTLKLAFLTGVAISDETQNDVERLVREQGLTAVVSPELAPEWLKEKYAGGTLVVHPVRESDSGTWVVTDNVLDPVVRHEVERFLGSDNEMRYVFGEYETCFSLTYEETLKVRTTHGQTT